MSGPCSGCNDLSHLFSRSVIVLSFQDETDESRIIFYLGCEVGVCGYPVAPAPLVKAFHSSLSCFGDSFEDQLTAYFWTFCSVP